MNIDEVPLNSVATIIMGLSPKGETYNNKGAGLPLLNGPTEFGDFYPNCTLFTIDSKRQCNKGDLIFCVRGSTTGRMNWADKEYSLGRGVCSIRGESSIDTRFIKYCIDVRLDALLKNAGGGTFPNLRKDDIEDFKIPYPSYRKKIASILSAYDDLIENNLKRIKILEEMAQMIYREWFVNFRFPGHEKVKMVKSELGMIPEGWEVRKLGDIAKEIRRGIDPSNVDPNTPYFGLEHLPRKSITLADWGTADQIGSTKLSFKKGEILFGKIRPYFHKVGVAPLDGICSSDTIVIAPTKPQYFGITISCVSSEDFVGHATQTSQGTKMPRADWKVLVKYPVVLPPSRLLDEFNVIVRNIVDQLHNYIFKNRNLRKTRDLLLPRLISGEIDVEGLDITV